MIHSSKEINSDHPHNARTALIYFGKSLHRPSRKYLSQTLFEYLVISHYLSLSHYGGRNNKFFEVVLSQ